VALLYLLWRRTFTLNALDFISAVDARLLKTTACVHASDKNHCDINHRNVKQSRFICVFLFLHGFTPGKILLHFVDQKKNQIRSNKISEFHSGDMTSGAVFMAAKPELLCADLFKDTH